MRRALVLPIVAAMAATSASGFEQGGPGSEDGEAYLAPAPWRDPAAPPAAMPVFPWPKAVVAVPVIDSSNRLAVRSAYNTYYDVARPAVGFSGSTASCTPGSISLAFQEWTISRINFLRTMAGVPGTTTLNSAVNAQEQGAALIMAANNMLHHFPPSNWACWSQAGNDGAGQSNLALGTGLIDSIPLYMSDPGNGNQPAGHRRWILHSSKNSFGIGQANAAQTANALFVFQFGAPVSVTNGITWPPRGYAPLALFPSPAGGEGQRWSFGYPNANFGSATVAMTVNGAPLAATVVSKTDDGYGDNTIVWELPVGHVVAKGSTYNVTISGVGNASSATFAYQVRPFDPADPVGSTTSDLNGDVRSDILYRNASTGQVWRLLMNGLSVAGGAMAFTEANTDWRIVADADFNGDGTADILYRNASTGAVYYIPFATSGLPAGGAMVTTEPNTAWKIVHAPDIDGDGRADILWWNSSTGQAYAMLMNGAAIGTQGFVHTEPNTAWKIVAVGDFAGSGRKNQLLWHNSVTGQVYLMTVTVSGGVFSQAGQLIYTEPSTSWTITGAADFNGDGKSDILWRNAVTGQVYVMLMNGGSIASQALVHTEPNTAWKVVAQGDYDGNGRADLLWRNDSTGQVYMMLMNGLAIASQALVYTEANTAWKVLGPHEYGK